MLSIRGLYNRLVSKEMRYRFYKLRHRKDIERLKTTVYPSDKGDFSLRHFYNNQCVFVHITKSAGTSLALSLFGELPYHYTAWQYRVIYGHKNFNRFFKFTFVRNPWDRLYSSFSYLKGGGWNKEDTSWAEKNLAGVESFDDFVMNWLSEDKLHEHIHFWPQSEFICDQKNAPLIDYLGYFENINQDFSHILKQLNLPQKKLKHTNASKRKTYDQVYTPQMIDKVASLYEQDIHNFGYTFDSFQRHHIQNKAFCKVSR
jgi:hypothetical protein